MNLDNIENKNNNEIKESLERIKSSFDETIDKMESRNERSEMENSLRREIYENKRAFISELEKNREEFYNVAQKIQYENKTAIIDSERRMFNNSFHTQNYNNNMNRHCGGYDNFNLDFDNTNYGCQSLCCSRKVAERKVCFEKEPEYIHNTFDKKHETEPFNRGFYYDGDSFESKIQTLESDFGKIRDDIFESIKDIKDRMDSLEKIEKIDKSIDKYEIEVNDKDFDSKQSLKDAAPLVRESIKLGKEQVKFLSLKLENIYKYLNRDNPSVYDYDDHLLEQNEIQDKIDTLVSKRRGYIREIDAINMKSKALEG